MKEKRGLMHDHFVLLIRHGEVLRKSIRPFVVSLSNHLRCRTHPSTSSGRMDFKHNLADSIIRIMKRVGRGYSFEALRAKILFAEGAMKAQNAKPKFERKGQPKPVRELTTIWSIFR